MSYIQTKIGPLEKDADGVDIPGSDLRGIKFNLGALIIFNEVVDFNNYAATSIQATIYAGLRGNCIAKKTEFLYTYEEVQDWIDVLDDGTIQAITAAYTESQVYKTRIKPIIDAEVEKLEKKTTVEIPVIEPSVSDLPEG